MVQKIKKKIPDQKSREKFLLFCIIFQEFFCRIMTLNTPTNIFTAFMTIQPIMDMIMIKPIKKL